MDLPVLVGGVRTPFVRAGSAFEQLDVLELSRVATAELLARYEVRGEDVDELIYGNVSRPTSYHNLARELVLAVNLPMGVPGSTVGLACASACMAITTAADKIRAQTATSLVAGGVESLSNVPLTLAPSFARRLIRASSAKTPLAKVQTLSHVRPHDLVPVAPAIKETSTGLTMGQSAEHMAQVNGITREEQDAFAIASHRNALQGWSDGRLASEVTPVYVKGKAVEKDGHVRSNEELSRMATLKPVFDKRYGTVTAGNASPLTDGAASVLIMSESKARSLGYTQLVAIRSYAYAAVDPGDQLLLAPAYAVPLALKRAGLSIKDIGLVEMHEAFAAQVLSTIKVMEANGLGEINRETLNVLGGSIALGHPFGATGARIATTLSNEMRRRNVQFGLMSVCAAGGNGAALVLELLP